MELKVREIKRKRFLYRLLHSVNSGIRLDLCIQTWRPISDSRLIPFNLWVFREPSRGLIFHRTSGHNIPVLRVFYLGGKFCLVCILQLLLLLVLTFDWNWCFFCNYNEFVQLFSLLLFEYLQGVLGP